MIIDEFVQRYPLRSLRMTLAGLEIFTSDPAKDVAHILQDDGTFQIVFARELEPGYQMTADIYLDGGPVSAEDGLPSVFPDENAWLGAAMGVFINGGAYQSVSGSGTFDIAIPPNVATPEPASLALWSLGGLAATLISVLRRFRSENSLGNASCLTPKSR